MDFNLTEEQQMLRDGAERFVRDHYGLEERRKQVASGEAFNPDLWRHYAEMGWLMLNVPEACGGLGMPMVESMLLQQALGRGMTLEPFITTGVLGACLLAQAENDALRDELLAPLMEGQVLMALAHMEPGGHDHQQQVGATVQVQGEGYRLHGHKFMVLDGATADQLIVSAQCAGDDGFSLFLVNATATGVSRESYPLIDGTQAADFHFDNAEARRLIGADKAAVALEDALDRATLMWLASAVGTMEACLEITSEYLKTRRQFGQPIGNFQALQHTMAEMFVSTQESHSILFQALAHIESDADVRRRSIAAAKLVIGEGLNFVAAQGVQLHGGYGITDEYAVSHIYKRALVLAKLGGDAGFHAEVFADLSAA